MPKFYVRTGDIRRVIVADNPVNAAVCSIILEGKDGRKPKLGRTILVSERGFDIHESDVLLNTSFVVNLLK